MRVTQTGKDWGGVRDDWQGEQKSAALSVSEQDREWEQHNGEEVAPGRQPGDGKDECGFVDAASEEIVVNPLRNADEEW